MDSLSTAVEHPSAPPYAESALSDWTGIRDHRFVKLVLLVLLSAEETACLAASVAARCPRSRHSIGLLVVPRHEVTDA